MSDARSGAPPVASYVGGAPLVASAATVKAPTDERKRSGVGRTRPSRRLARTALSLQGKSSGVRDRSSLA